MSIPFSCPECGHAHRAAEDLAGKRGRCKRCGTTLTVPQADTAGEPPVLYWLDDASDDPSEHEADTSEQPPSALIGLDLDDRLETMPRGASTAGGTPRGRSFWPVALAALGIVVLVATLLIVSGRSGGSRKDGETPGALASALAKSAPTTPSRPVEAESEPAPDTPPPPPPVVPVMAAPVDLKRDGIFGFPQARSQVLLDKDNLRVSVWNNTEYLYLQAIVWADSDDALGDDYDGVPMADWSHLMLDVDGDRQVTPLVDRRYSLSRTPGLHYRVMLGAYEESPLKEDSRGRGAIRYIGADGERRVRVDSFAIPLAEIQALPGEVIRLLYWAKSPRPPLRLNSAGLSGYNEPYNMPADVFHDVSLHDRADALDITQVPDGREIADPTQAGPTTREGHAALNGTRQEARTVDTPDSQPGTRP